MTAGMESVLTVLQIAALFAPMVVLAGLLVWWQHARAWELLRRWAVKEGMEIVHAEKRYLRQGPFFLDHGRGQFIFRLVIRDRDGQQRAGWIRIGGWVWGVASENVKVKWDGVDRDRA